MLMIKSGIINVLKPPHISSNGVTVQIRHALSDTLGKGIKVGHAGTLDPAGMGVLPVTVGKATKLFDYFLQFNKKYRAEFVFGCTTDTLDSYGSITERQQSEKFSIDQIKSACARLTGNIDQLPPNYSAKSVNGVKAYDLARKGISAELKTKTVKVTNFKPVCCSGENSWIFDIECSSGTYIRSLCRDLAKELNTIGYMSWIIRTECHGFLIQDAVSLSDVKDSPFDYLKPIDDYIKDIPSIIADTAQNKQVLNGAEISAKGYKDGIYSVYLSEKLVGLYKVCNEVAKLEVWLHDD